jgi:carbamoyltransferase
LEVYILGISAFYHDSAACLIKNGIIIAAAQEERFTRKKNDSRFPYQAINYCIKEANIESTKIVNVVFYEKPFIKFERLLETYLAYAPKGFASFATALPVWVKEKIFQKSLIANELTKIFGKSTDWYKRLLFSEHHLSHAASAFYPSPFESAAILTVDGVGEWTTTSVAIGKGKDIDIIKEIHFPHSIGLLYSAFTYYTGFKVNSSEYKVMGLAPYGEPKYEGLIKEKLINIAEDGSFQLDMSYFNYATGLTMTNRKFNNLFGGPPRKPEEEITQKEMDLAASIQKVIEDVLIKIIKNIAEETGENNLCLAGGVALNCVSNSKLKNEKVFENIWVQPASGDAGGALGAALAVWHLHYKNKRTISLQNDDMKGAYLGPSFTNNKIEMELKKCKANAHKVSNLCLIETVSNAIINQKAIGWMQGRMEFGPRSLGNRSIIADARSPSMQKKLNLKIKYRESFRPFAPSILSDCVSDWFEYNTKSPYMSFVADIKEDKLIELSEDDTKLFGINKLNVTRSRVPAITHVNNTARIQTIDKNINALFHNLISDFNHKTGCPLIINTSFNVRGEPIVCSPTDAFKCFMGTELDILVIGNYILFKEEQDVNLIEKYKEKYELD